MENIKVLGIVYNYLVIYIGEGWMLSCVETTDSEKEYLIECGNVREFSSFDNICEEYNIDKIWIP